MTFTPTDYLPYDFANRRHIGPSPSEMDEMLTLADRILVLHRGRIAATLSGSGATRDAVLAAAMGHDMDSPATDTK